MTLRQDMRPDENHARGEARDLWLTPPPRKPRKVRRPPPPFTGRGFISPARYLADPAARRHVDAVVARHGLRLDDVAWLMAYRDRDVLLVYRRNQRGKLRVRRGVVAANRRTFLRG